MKTLEVDLVEVLKSLSDSTNLKILALIKLYEELCVCEFEDLLESPQPTVSRHLKALTDSGLIRVRKDGRWRYYSLQEIPSFVEEVIELAVETYGIIRRERRKKCGDSK